MSLTRPSSVPDAPGCYLFSSGSRVVYVGKAKSLSQRLASYFPADVSSLHPRTQAMLREATAVDWVLCDSETDALLTEAALVRRHDPAYNVKLRDDSTYPYVWLSDHELPRVAIRHGERPTRGRVFGPVVSGRHARDLVDLVGRVSGVRPCRDQVLVRHQRLGRMCVLGQTGRCAGPCVEPDGYGEAVSSAVALLSGDMTAVRADLETQMRCASSEQRFEQAAARRDEIRALDALFERSTVSSVRGQVAAAAVTFDELGAAVQMLVVRDGVLVACPSVLVDRPLAGGELSERDVLDAVVPSLLAQQAVVPTRLAVAVEVSPATAEALAAVLGRRVEVRVPRRGPLVDLLALASRNSAEVLQRARLRRASDAASRRDELACLASELGLAAPPLVIECLDVSHLDGRQTTAGFAVLVEGQVVRRRHRSFNLPDRNDDVASVGAALARRIGVWHSQQDKEPSRRDVTLGSLPDLFVVDGGRPQLDAARCALADAGVSVPVVALAKRLEEVFVPDKVLPLRLPVTSPALFVLQRARDAAHDLSKARSARRRTL